MNLLSNPTKQVNREITLLWHFIVYKAISKIIISVNANLQLKKKSEYVNVFYVSLYISDMLFYLIFNRYRGWDVLRE